MMTSKRMNQWIREAASRVIESGRKLEMPRVNSLPIKRRRLEEVRIQSSGKVEMEGDKLRRLKAERMELEILAFRIKTNNLIGALIQITRWTEKIDQEIRNLNMDLQPNELQTPLSQSTTAVDLRGQDRMDTSN
ncbi:NS4 [Orungo virus]|uniref:NS4 n=1 Tax=Orungo virus TaxID=40058 RepID=W5QM02_9REOV|nr:NS4 [Orungo virus]AFX73396.1 NS4 [Orungo virus]